MKKYSNILKIVLLFVVITLLYSFTNKRNDNRVIKHPKITFLDDDKLFITYQTVNKLLIQNIKGSTSVIKDALDLNTIENALNTNQMIQEAQVYVTVNGRLEVKIKQRTPIARVNASVPYYIDVEGKKMPLSTVYSARVPLITGAISQANLTDAYAVSKYINNDAFLKKNIIGIHCTNNRFELKLRTEDFVVQLGKATALHKKFSNFKAFYKKALKDGTLHNYTKVNLEFGNQVVCTKK